MNIIEEEVKLQSAPLEREVTVTILKPEEIGSAEDLHLLVLNDGQELENLRIKSTLEGLLAKDRIMPLMVAAVHAGDRKQEYGTLEKADVKGRGSRAGQYAEFVVNELLPLAHRHAGVEHFGSKGIAGCSLGGLSAVDIAWNHPDKFSVTAAFSGSFWWRDAHLRRGYSDDKNRIMHQVIRHSDYKPRLRFFFQTGTKDEAADRNKNGIIDSIDDAVDVIKELEAKGYKRPDDIKYLEVVGGQHDVPTWAEAMPHFLTWAFGR